MKDHIVVCGLGHVGVRVVESLRQLGEPIVAIERNKSEAFGSAVEDMGYVRDDGKTMTAQPHLNLDPQKMWTTDHLKRLGPLLSPNVLFNEMSDAERTAFIDDYRRQGPAGRPAPQNA